MAFASTARKIPDGIFRRASGSSINRSSQSGFGRHLHDERTGLQTLSFTAADDLSGRDTQQLQDALSARRDEAFETQEGLDFLARETGGIPIATQ